MSTLEKTDNIRTELKDFFVRECYISSDSLNFDTPLVSSKLLTSLDVMDLISYIEETHDIDVDTLEAEIEHFDSINKIVDYITGKSAKN